MTLEFERITSEIEKMAQMTAQREKALSTNRAQYEEALSRYATDWDRIALALAQASEKADQKFYRSARPFNQTEPLNVALPAPSPPQQATIIATDGSQIMPDRHAAYLYYLINIGGIVYHHGQGRQPDVFSLPDLKYPEAETAVDDTFDFSSGAVSIERDLAEIGTLAKKSWDLRYEVTPPIVSIVDQRLLYWPIGNSGVADNRAVTSWTKSITIARDAGAWLAGYIDRPGTQYVATLLHTLIGMDDSEFDWRSLGKRGSTLGITDTVLFSKLLKPGERSKIFTIVSPPNEQFANQDSQNEICFFYVNPSAGGKQIARVDIPRSVAENEAAVTAVHSLIIDQCRLMGDYPYVLARADEMAVVGREDASQLNILIDLVMQNYGISADLSAKQSSKGLARGGKTRHQGF